jgi:CheY-like chemotaxis protein
VDASLFKPARQSQLRETLVSLLAATGSAESSGEAPVLSPQPRAEINLRILVAEDNPVNQHVARLQLEKFGYRPDLVVDGLQAVAAVQAQPYDIVMMDCQMPELDGFEATRRIRTWEAERRAQGLEVAPLHIIAMTANAMVGDREECLAAGMDDYLTKPVRQVDLAAALARSPVAQK